MRSLLRNNVFLFSLTILTTVGCRKDPHLVEEPPVNSGCVEEWCDDLPPDGGFGYNYIIQGPQFYRPCFNPNNPDEFIYTRVGFTSDIELVKYNLVTKQEDVLLSPMSQGDINWSNQGWLIFRGINGAIWKIKDDGTQLAQVTDFEGFIPVFGKDSSYFMVAGINPSLSDNNHYRSILNLNGELIDSIRVDFDSIYIGTAYTPIDYNFHNGYFFFTDHNYPNSMRTGVCRLENNSGIVELNSFFNNGGKIDLDANANFIVYTIFWQGLFKINLSTKQTSKIRFGCKTRYYMDLSMSPNADKVLVEKVICTPINNYDIQENHEIWLIDLNGCGEEKILGQ